MADTNIPTCEAILVTNDGTIREGSSFNDLLGEYAAELARKGLTLLDSDMNTLVVTIIKGTEHNHDRKIHMLNRLFKYEKHKIARAYALRVDDDVPYIRVCVDKFDCSCTACQTAKAAVIEESIN